MRLPGNKQEHTLPMKSLLFVATALISVITANRVIHLTADNFDAIVDGTRNVFVKFEASWCGPCKRMAPIMDKVAAESFPDLDGETILAAIDADAEIEIADRFEIGSFPTVKLFLKGRELDESIEYNGDRSSENISRFIRSQVAMNEQSLPAEIKQIKPDIPLTQLLKELAKVGPSRKTLKSGTLNFNNFASGFFGDETDNDDFYKSNAPDLQMNLKQKKIRNRKDKTRSRRNVGSVHRAEDKSGLPLVSAEQAKSIIKSAGSKPVILIFFSPSKQSP